jgi:hypothetical protein
MFASHYNYHSLLHAKYKREQKQTSNSSYQLHRYNHETVSNNTVHRDIPPIVFVLVLLFFFIIILSQILVVHYSRPGTHYSSMQKIHSELRQMDESMETILRQNVSPIDKWRLLFHIQTYVYHFQYLIDLFNTSNQTKIIYSDNQKKRDYCNEEPSQLSRFRSMKNIVFIFDYFSRRTDSSRQWHISEYFII